MIWIGWSNGRDRWIRNSEGKWQRVECAHFPEERCQRCNNLNPPGCLTCNGPTCDCENK